MIQGLHTILEYQYNDIGFPFGESLLFLSWNRITFVKKYGMQEIQWHSTQDQFVISIAKNALNKDFGIELVRMETDGKGESEAVAPNTTTEGKATNRRVEIVKL